MGESADEEVEEREAERQDTEVEVTAGDTLTAKVSKLNL